MDESTYCVSIPDFNCPFSIFCVCWLGAISLSAQVGADDKSIAVAKTLLTNPNFNATSPVLFLNENFKT